MYTTIDSCNICGAPVYVPTIWMGIIPPPRTYSCFCRTSRHPTYQPSTIGPLQWPWPKVPSASWTCPKCKNVYKYIDSCLCDPVFVADDPDVSRFDHEYIHEVCIHCDLSDACEETECPARLREEVARLHDYNEQGLVCSKHWVHPSKCCNGKYTAHLISERNKKRTTYLENELADWRSDVEEVDEILEGTDLIFGSEASTAENVQILIDKYESKLNIAKLLIKEIRGTLRLIESGAISFKRGSVMVLKGLTTAALSEMDE